MSPYNIIMFRPLFLSAKRKKCAFSSKKQGKCLEGIGKTCTFALAFQNYGKRLTLRATRKELRLTLRATRKEFFEKITYNRE